MGTNLLLFGYEAALNFLIDECLDELKIRPLDQRLTLIRYYVKMNRLRIEEMRDKKNQKGKEKNEKNLRFVRPVGN